MPGYTLLNASIGISKFGLLIKWSRLMKSSKIEPISIDFRNSSECNVAIFWSTLVLLFCLSASVLSSFNDICIAAIKIKTIYAPILFANSKKYLSFELFTSNLVLKYSSETAFPLIALDNSMNDESGWFLGLGIDELYTL